MEPVEMEPVEMDFLAPSTNCLVSCIFSLGRKVFIIFISMKKVAVFPGSFDPITIGHVDIIERAHKLFDQVYVAVGINSQKKYLFPLDQRLKWLEEVFSAYDNVHVDSYEGLTTKYCESVGANYMIRGIRSAGDFEYEKTIAHLNNAMDPDLETLLILAKPEYSSISSTIVREIIKGNGDVSKFVPVEVVDDL